MRPCAAVAVLAGLLLALAPAAPARSQPSAWIELRTPHFLIISNGTGKQVRRVGRELEQIRAALERSFPGLRLWPQDGLVVLALKDEASMQALVASPHVDKDSELPAGIFLDAQERTCILLRLDQDDESYHPAFHEYVHALLAFNLPGLPLWLAEGLAELYANAQFDAHGAYVGGQGWQTPYLHDRALLPLVTLRAALPTAPLYRDPVRSQLFYAESWALVHFLVFGPGMGNGARLSQYLARLQAGDEEGQTFEQTFGPLLDLQSRLELFRQTFAPRSLRLKDLPACDENGFALRALPSEEWLALQGSLEIPKRFPHTGFASVRP